MQGDCDDFFKILSWFRYHNSFNLPAMLMCLYSGFIDENNIVDCDWAEEIGTRIQELLNNQTFIACSYKREYQIKTFEDFIRPYQ